MVENFGHIEPLQHTQIGTTRIVLGTNPDTGKYHILSFEGASATAHVNEILEKDWHEDSHSEAMTSECNLAAKVYLQSQLFHFQEGTERFGSLSDFLNS